MNLLLGMLAVAAVPPRVDALVAELKKPGCPSLFEQLVPDFQKAAPRGSWGPFCEAFARGGALKSISEAGAEKGMAVYRVSFEKAEVKLGAAFDAEGRISGLFAQPWPKEVLAATTRFRWPLKKPSVVFWGGATVDANYHAAYPRQQRAMDVMLAGPEPKQRTSNADFVSWGAEVVAAADGKVRVVVDGVPENVPGEMDPTLTPGNVVVIEHAAGEYAHYCHLKPGSTRVKAGAVVKAGQTLGLLGNSGNSSEPHLHFHVQDSARMSEGQGLEPLFYGVCRVRDGKVAEPVPVYRAQKGDVVAPCE